MAGRSNLLKWMMHATGQVHHYLDSYPVQFNATYLSKQQLTKDPKRGALPSQLLGRTGSLRKTANCTILRCFNGVQNRGHSQDITS